MYDLPVTTNGNRKANEKFRKYLLRRGYIFMQKSVYVKLIRSRRTVPQEILSIKNEAPKGGIVNVLPLKLDDFLKLETVSGMSFHMEVFADDIVVL